MKKALLLVVVAAALAAGAYFFWTRRAPAAPQELTLHGNVDIRQVSLAFDGSGRIAEVRVEEGDQVRAGAVLATLDTRTLTLQVDQASAQIEAQEQTLRRLRNGPRPQEIDQARSRLATAQAEAARANDDLTRLQGIAAKTQGRGVSQQDLDRAQSAVRTASTRTDELREALRLVQAGSRPEEIAGAEAQVKASRAQLALLRHQIELGELKAPVDAVVRSRLLEPGDMATPQRPVLTLALTQPKWVRVYVSEPDLGKVRVGGSARIRTDSQPDLLTGKISFIASTAEFTPKSVETEQLRTSLVYEVRILVDDPTDILRLGQPVTAVIARAGA
jgi:HlyD family secretion protein